MKIMFFISSLPEDELYKHQFPLGPGYIASYLVQHFPGLQIKITATEEDIYQFKPDLLGISSVSQCYNFARAVAERAKGLQIPIIIGGYHISALPHRLDDCFSAGVIGEGETPMLELIRLLLAHRSLPPTELSKIPGICFSHRSQVIINPGPPALNPNQLPYPQRNISRGARNIAMFSSRGCTYRCKYCASSRHWHTWRAVSAEYFVEELKYLMANYGATSIQLQDDLFFADRRRVFSIMNLMEKHQLIGKLTFRSFITSNLAREDLLKAAKYMGFRSIRFGAESGSNQVLRAMKGSWASVENHQRCVDLCNQLGLKVSAAFMLGTPGETEEDLERTYQFLKRNQGLLEIEGLYLTTPIPGTPYWDLAMQKGLVSEDMDWDCLNLDFNKKKSFDSKKAIYLNQDLVPMEKVMEYYERLHHEFSK